MPSAKGALNRLREAQARDEIPIWTDHESRCAEPGDPKISRGWSRKSTLMLYTRRDLIKLGFAALPMTKVLGAVNPKSSAVEINSKFSGVQVGAITYSFRGMSGLDEMIKAMVEIGLGEAELMSDTAEASVGAPSRGQGSRGQTSAEQQAARRTRAEELRQWRLSVSMDKFKAVRKKFDDAGVRLQLLCFNGLGSESMSDDEIEYAFTLARALGVKAISTSTQVSGSKRTAPFADKHKMMVGYHGHSNVTNPDEFALPASWDAAMSYSKYNGINLDIGHFTAAGGDAVAYMKERHGRITNLHLKDRKKNQGPNVPWGQGDTPIKEVLQLMKKEKYPFPANIEYEYRGEDIVAEVKKCFQYCKSALS